MHGAAETRDWELRYERHCEEVRTANPGALLLQWLQLHSAFFFERPSSRQQWAATAMTITDEFTGRIEGLDRRVISNAESISIDGRSGGQVLSLLLLHSRPMAHMLAQGSLDRWIACCTQGETHGQGEVP